MLEIIINDNMCNITQSFSCDKEMADVFADIIDKIIIDDYIKISPKKCSLTLEEQKSIIAKKRKELLELIDSCKINTEYIYSKENSCAFKDLV